MKVVILQIITLIIISVLFGMNITYLQHVNPESDMFAPIIAFVMILAFVVAIVATFISIYIRLKELVTSSE